MHFCHISFASFVPVLMLQCPTECVRRERERGREREREREREMREREDVNKRSEKHTMPPHYAIPSLQNQHYYVLHDHCHIIYETRTGWTLFKLTSLTNCPRLSLSPTSYKQKHTHAHILQYKYCSTQAR